MKTRRYNAHQGTILIVALWALSLLAAFAVILNAGIRQKINVFSKVEDRNKAVWLAEAGIKKAVAVLNMEFEAAGENRLAMEKMARHNNPRDFGEIRLNGGVCEVGYTDPHPRGNALRRYGITDEESKLNVNTADLIALGRLMEFALSAKKEDAQALARSIIDWRTSGESELKGFYGEKYYENLEHPYEPKNADFELLEELLLVQGVTQDILEKLSPYLTVYGPGTININTAPAYVLFSSGLSENLVKKIVVVRRGRDGLETTEDDFVFRSANGIVEDLLPLAGLEKEEIDEINGFVSRGKIGVESRFYRIQSHAALDRQKAKARIDCVFDASTHTFSFWKAQY